MNRPTGTTDPNLQTLIVELKRTSTKHKVKIWKDVARLLSVHSRRRIVTNLSTVNRSSKEGDIIVIPGKLLGSGSLQHKLTVSAWGVSGAAKEKLSKAGGNFMPISQLIKKHPKGKNIRILR
jgi:large subunit ribosomal protein L18e